ncbi:hypothetical protein CQ043_22520 [Paenibacillus sp. MYb63]|nr:hypothetical protein CQ043_22520 [Paenibacillus sp. MYb63]PRA45655.1 hypothetical protein CQ061_22480 [Paenibacillus sp. MYb67]
MGAVMNRSCVWGKFRFGFGPSANESDTPYIAVIQAYEILTNLSILITDKTSDLLRKNLG